MVSRLGFSPWCLRANQSSSFVNSPFVKSLYAPPQETGISTPLEHELHFLAVLSYIPDPTLPGHWLIE
jgi:hypothetical protein